VLLLMCRQLSARVRCVIDWAVEWLRSDPALALRPSCLAAPDSAVQDVAAGG
jgi:hypothetical protein